MLLWYTLWLTFEYSVASFIRKLAFRVRSMFAYKSCQTFLPSPSKKHTDVSSLLCLLASRYPRLPCKTAHFAVPTWRCLVQAPNWIDVATDHSFIQDSTLNLPLYLSVSTEVGASLRFPCWCSLHWMHLLWQREESNSLVTLELHKVHEDWQMSTMKHASNILIIILIIIIISYFCL